MIAFISISKQGKELADTIAPHFNNSVLYTSEKWIESGTLPIEGKLKEFCQTLFQKYDKLVFIMACGIVVRSIAPWLGNKTSDPAVVVIDDCGMNVISLLSGHIGGANNLCNTIALIIGANPVITTSSDINNLPAVDMMAVANGLVIDSMADAKNITAKIISREKISLSDKYGLLSKYNHYFTNEGFTAKILVSNNLTVNENLPFAKLIPKNIILGIGCKKDTPPSALAGFISETLKMLNIDARSISAIASISIKENEPAIINAANEYKCPLLFYPVAELQTVEHLFVGSHFVQSTVGVSSVSETAAFLAGNKSGTFLLQKQILNGITISVFEKTINSNNKITNS